MSVNQEKVEQQLDANLAHQNPEKHHESQDSNPEKERNILSQSIQDEEKGKKQQGSLK